MNAALLRESVERRPVIAIALALIALASLYWLVVASDRYESEARVVLQRADLAGGQTVDFAALITGAAGVNRTDQLQLREHLLSLDMVRMLDSKLRLRHHYSNQGDWISRLWWTDTPMERFQHYLRNRISVEMDEFAGVLVVKAQAYTPAVARDIAEALLLAGEAHMNQMGRSLAQEQVQFLEQQVSQLGERLRTAKAAVLAFQNRNGMVSPSATVETVAGIVARFEAQVAELQSRRTGLLAYLQPTAPQVKELDAQIAAMEKQIALERARLAAPTGKPLNAMALEFQRLQFEAEFTQQVFNGALIALEKGRVEATRTLKKVQVLQSASVPEYPLQPRRIYSTLVFALVALLVASALQLLIAIVRDHQD
ncbi:MAG: chain-length determining protein [Rubrivivax sp.]|jgi:capsular polysaccharide transport system permease protein